MNENPIPNSESVMTPNVLYKNYAKKALIAGIVYYGLILSSIIIKPFFGYDLQNTFWAPSIFALLFIYINLRGFARAQVHENDARDVRCISWGVLISLICTPLLTLSGYVKSFTWTWHYVDVPDWLYDVTNWTTITLTLFVVYFAWIVGAIISISGIIRLTRSQTTPQPVRHGMVWILIFTIIAANNEILLGIINYVCFNILDHYIDTNPYDILSIITILSIFTLIIGGVKVIRSKHYVTTPQYEAICAADNEATSPTNAIRVWLYTLGFISMLQAIYWYIIKIHTFGFGFDFGFVGLNLGTISLFLAVTIWLFLNRGIRKNRANMIAMIIMMSGAITSVNAGIYALLSSFFFSYYDAFYIYYVTSNVVGYTIMLGATIFFLVRIEIKRWVKIATLGVLGVFLFTMLFDLDYSIFAIFNLLAIALPLIATFCMPINWPRLTKWATLIVVGAFALFMLFFTIVSNIDFDSDDKEKLCVNYAEVFEPSYDDVEDYVSPIDYDDSDYYEEAYVEDYYEDDYYDYYNVGDYYNEDGKEGVVFEVWNNGENGKIVSLNETYVAWDSRVEWDYDVDGYVGGTYTYADSYNYGENNTDEIMSRSDNWYFDAFEWCRAKGSSWYLPAYYELEQIATYRDKLNSTLSSYGGTYLSGVYWSSTEYDDDEARFYVLGESPAMDEYSNMKGHSYYVRAVADF